MKTFILFSLLLATVIAISPKISGSLKTSLETKNQFSIFISMRESTDQTLQQVQEIFTKSVTTHEERTTAVYNALKSLADSSQAQVLQLLNTYPLRKLQVQSFWINNHIYVENADKIIIEKLVSMDEVSAIFEEENFHIMDVYRGPDVFGRDNIQVEWALDQMRVPEVWNMVGGNMGEGLRIGNIDTGVRGSHESFAHKWVGLAGHGWYDPEQKTSFPNDIYNHGTHTCGTVVGDNGIGIAPSAEWMACKGYRDDGSASESTFVDCMQYMLCPVDYQGNNADCTKSAHVVTNSWGLGGNNQIWNPALSAWNTAGIVSSFSAGNEASWGCSSIRGPADQPIAIAVGSTGRSDALSSFSSLGPGAGGILKPDFSAPGESIYSASATADNAYASFSGTSMSCPNASGVLALMKAYDRNLTYQRALDALINTTVRGPSRGESCGGVSDSQYPNNHVGHGRIDAFAAIQRLRSLKA